MYTDFVGRNCKIIWNERDEHGNSMEKWSRGRVLSCDETHLKFRGLADNSLFIVAIRDITKIKEMRNE